MQATLTRELEAAVSAVSQAAIACRAVQRNLVSARTLEKKDRSPVTVADFASQAVVCGLLADRFPDDPVVAEENADELRKPDAETIRRSVCEHVRSVCGEAVGETTVLDWIDHGATSAGGGTGRFWTLDPIDGTKGFLRAEQYAIALALIEDGRIVLGVLGCPNLPCVASRSDETGVLMTAVSGGGSRWQNLGETDEGRPIRVSDVSDVSQARFVESVESGHSDQSQSAQIAKLLGITTQPVRLDSQAKYATVARGEASIYLRLPTSGDYREKIWDHAAGSIVVEEAGGTVTDITGRPLDFSHGRKLETNQGVVATNGGVHNEVIRAVVETLGL